MRSKKLVSLTCAGLLAGCFYGLSAVAASAATPTLNGAGSTLVAPIEAEWAAVWDTANSSLVNYSPVGSGTGDKDIAAGLVDFGASDAPLSVYTGVPANIVQIPWALTATGVSYHLSGLKPTRRGPASDRVRARQDLSRTDHQLEQPADQGVEQGREDPQEADHGVLSAATDPATPTRSPGTCQMSARHVPEQGRRLDHGFLPGRRRREGQRGHGAGAHRHERRDRLHRGHVSDRQQAPGRGDQERRRQLRGSEPERNRGRGVRDQRARSNNEVTIVDPGKRRKKAYPISTFTYAFVPTNAPQGALIKSFIGYAITQGQTFGPSLDFSPLPQSVVNADEAALNSIN